MNTTPDVIRKCLWPVCLVSLFITGILSVDCTLLHIHLRRVIWQNLRLLSTMSNSFPAECLRERKAFELPQEILSYTQPLKRGIKEAFYEMSMLAFNIFTPSTFQPTWEEKHLEQIQTGLDQQLQYLEQCLEEEKENEDKKDREEDERKHPGAMMLQLTHLELRRYFHRVVSFLKDKKYSRCAWEIVRVEIRRCFYYFQKFTALLSGK
ncbi:interferon kappa [Pteronotus mesoamericanus]|uniref:interferon kappa n=1 Tax=Pteronotus mesoamericanus TaxID=1884717 RepID=UPI0023ECFF2E|nr:interferon kappa [Pteronotus parnellii mesoamericanus]